MNEEELIRLIRERYENVTDLFDKINPKFRNGIGPNQVYVNVCSRMTRKDFWNGHGNPPVWVRDHLEKGGKLESLKRTIV